MSCPFCKSEFIVEYYPIFTEEMERELVTRGMNKQQREFHIELWENRQSPTGGTCLTCKRDWVHESPELDHMNYTTSGYAAGL